MAETVVMTLGKNFTPQIHPVRRKRRASRYFYQLSDTSFSISDRWLSFISA